jgi:lipopolysaccharide biosynthesis glycosyltransferase
MKINLYYSINKGKIYQQVVVSLISLLETNKNNDLYIYILDNEIKEYKTKLLSEQQIKLLNDLICKYNPNNRLFHIDVSSLIYKYLMTLPNLDGVNDLC